MISLAAILGASAAVATDPIHIVICVAASLFVKNIWKAIGLSFVVSFSLYALMLNATGGHISVLIFIAHLVSAALITSLSFYVREKFKQNKSVSEPILKDEPEEEPLKIPESNHVKASNNKESVKKKKRYLISTQGYNFGQPSSGGFKIIHWYFNEGDFVNSGDNLVDIEGDEWVSTLASEHTGVLAAIYIHENRRFKPNADIGEIHG